MTVHEMRFIDNIIELKNFCPEAYEFLNSFEIKGIDNGSYFLNSGIVANVDRYEPRDKCECPFESHNCYIDIQCDGRIAV